MSTVTVPSVAVRVALNPSASVQVGMQFVDPGGRVRNCAVTPLGRVEVIENVTGADEPLVSVAVISSATEGLIDPWSIVRLGIDGPESEKSKGTVEAVTWIISTLLVLDE